MVSAPISNWRSREGTAWWVVESVVGRVVQLGERGESVSKFKPGDLVRCIEEFHCPDIHQCLGQEFVVDHVTPTGNLQFTGDCFVSTVGWSPWRFELVESTKPAVSTTLPHDSEARKATPLWSGPMSYFPAALAGVARCCVRGNAKHNPDKPMQHNRSKSTDHGDALARHMIDLREDFGHGVGYDKDGHPTVDNIAWRALALCQEWYEQHGAPVAPAATNVGGSHEGGK